MNQLEFVAKAETATRRFGQAIGKHLAARTVLYLNGTLGAGKSRLVQAIASGLDIDPEHVQSPTFTLMTPHAGRLTLVHVDAYRIADLDEAEQLGLADWLEADCVLAIEWANRVEEALPKADVRIEIEHLDESKRRFMLTGDTTMGQELLSQLQHSRIFSDHA